MKNVSVMLILIMVFLAACQAQQASDGVTYVPIDKISVEDSPTIKDVSIDKNSTNMTKTPLDSVEEVEEAMEDLEEATEDLEAMEDISEDVEEVEEVMEDLEETSMKSKEIVIIVEETELVELAAVAEDPDADEIKITFSTPLDNTGKWQTTYGDQGEYTLTITATDGELTTTKDALLIVNKKEEMPTINKQSPENIKQDLLENSQLTFAVTAMDLNKDPLTYEWKLDGQLVSSTDSYLYRADYASAGSHTLKVDVSDGNAVATVIWSLTVKNVDRPPVLSIIPDATLRETEVFTLNPQASDPDGDKLTFKISDPVGNDGIWQTTYNDAGVYTVTVTVSDGELEDSQDVKITVINVNRPPVIDDIIKVK